MIASMAYNKGKADSALTPEQLASKWKVTTGHLANLRCYRKWPSAPKWFKVGRSVRYAFDDVLAFEKSHKR